MNAQQVCSKAAELVGGDRAKTHGDKQTNFQNTADLWSAWLWRRGLLKSGDGLSAQDVAAMMILLKLARTLTGSFNIDDYVDIAGYAGCAAEISPDARCQSLNDGLD